MTGMLGLLDRTSNFFHLLYVIFLLSVYLFCAMFWEVPSRLASGCFGEIPIYRCVFTDKPAPCRKLLLVAPALPSHAASLRTSVPALVSVCTALQLVRPEVSVPCCVLLPRMLFWGRN